MSDIEGVDMPKQIGFAVRSEFTSIPQDEKYLQGYIKGVCSALTDLNIPQETVAEVRANLEDYRKWVLDTDAPEEEDFYQWRERTKKTTTETEQEFEYKDKYTSTNFKIM